MRRFLLHIAIYLSLYSAKLLFFYLLSDSLLIGVGAQLWPGNASLTHSFRGEDVSLFSTRVNPDWYTYLTPFHSYKTCISDKDKNTKTSGFDVFASIGRSCLCVFPASYRLPGYGIWFYLFGLERTFEEWLQYSLHLHIFWASLAALAFGNIVQGLTRSTLMGIIAMLIYAFWPFSLRYEWTIGSESMNYSFITLFIWSYWKARGEHRGWLFLSGLLLLKATLIRPMTFAIFLPAPLLLLLQGQRRWQRALFFLLPLLVFQIYWQTCNLASGRKIYLLSKTLHYEGIEHSEWGAVAFLLGSFGDNYYWFYNPKYRFPKRAFTSEFGPLAEREIDSIYRGYFDGQIPEVEAAAYANAWRESIRREKKFLYYIGSRFYAAVNFLTCHLQENFYYTDAFRAGIIYLVAYSLSSVFWLLGVLIGLIASVYYIVHWRKYPFLAFLGLSANAAWGSYVLLLQIQSRYFLFPLAFLLPLSIVFLWEKVLKRPVAD